MLFIIKNSQVEPIAKRQVVLIILMSFGAYMDSILNLGIFGAFIADKGSYHNILIDYA